MADETVPSLTIVASRHGQATVIELVGAADIDQGEPLRHQLRQAGAEGNPVVLDLRRLSFISSTWLGVLIALYKDCRARGAAVRLARPTGPIERILRTTRLSALMPICPTLEQALQQAPGASP